MHLDALSSASTDSRLSRTSATHHHHILPHLSLIPRPLFSRWNSKAPRHRPAASSRGPPFIPETFDPTRPLLPRGAEAPRILIALMVPTCSLLPEALEIVQVTVSREHLLYCALQCLLVLPGKWVRNQPEARDRSRARHTMTRTERHCAFCIATVLLSCTTVVMPLGTEYRALCSSRKLGANATPPLMKLVLSISMQGPGSDPHGFHPNRQRAR